MEYYIDSAHEKSLLPDGKKWSLVWNDEFDGDTLDRTKWDFRRNLLHQKHETFTDEGVSFDGNSNMLLSLIEKDGHYYSPHLQTGENFMDRPTDSNYGKFQWPIAKFSEPKFLHKYGYYEIRCKLQEQPGWWSAFWLQSPIIGASPDPGKTGVEIDIMENFKPNEVTSGNFHGGYGKDQYSFGRIRYNIEDTPDGFHYWGVDWNKDGYVFYCDGKETCRVTECVSHTEEFILVTTEVQGYRNSDNPSPELKKAVLPDAFVVDFVRVYDEV